MKEVVELKCEFSTDLAGFAEFVNNDKYADMVFIAGEQKIWAHRAIVSARCSYFQALMDRWLPNQQPTQDLVKSVKFFKFFFFFFELTTYSTFIL